MSRVLSFTVRLSVPRDASIEDARSYVESAVRSECGNYPPEDPRFEIGDEHLEVRRVRAK